MNIVLVTILGIIVVYLLFYSLLVMSKQDKLSDKVFRIYHGEPCNRDCANCPLKNMCAINYNSILTRQEIAEIWLIQNDYICREEV